MCEDKYIISLCMRHCTNSNFHPKEAILTFRPSRMAYIEDCSVYFFDIVLFQGAEYPIACFRVIREDACGAKWNCRCGCHFDGCCLNVWIREGQVELERRAAKEIKEEGAPAFNIWREPPSTYPTAIFHCPSCSVISRFNDATAVLSVCNRQDTVLTVPELRYGKSLPSEWSELEYLFLAVCQ